MGLLHFFPVTISLPENLNSPGLLKLIYLIHVYLDEKPGEQKNQPILLLGNLKQWKIIQRPIKPLSDTR